MTSFNFLRCEIPKGAALRGAQPVTALDLKCSCQSSSISMVKEIFGSTWFFRYSNWSLPRMGRRFFPVR